MLQHRKKKLSKKDFRIQCSHGLYKNRNLKSVKTKIIIHLIQNKNSFILPCTLLDLLKNLGYTL